MISQLENCLEKSRYQMWPITSYSKFIEAGVPGDDVGASSSFLFILSFHLVWSGLSHLIYLDYSKYETAAHLAAISSSSHFLSAFALLLFVFPVHPISMLLFLCCPIIIFSFGSVVTPIVI